MQYCLLNSCACYEDLLNLKTDEVNLLQMIVGAIGATIIILLLMLLWCLIGALRSYDPLFAEIEKK